MELFTIFEISAHLGQLAAAVNIVLPFAKKIFPKMVF